MIRHLSFLLVFALTAFCAAAQSVGNWNIMSVYGGRADALVDAGDRMYCLNSGNLFSYDKQSDEIRHISGFSGLNDVKIERIAYNDDKGYLVIAYASANIDLLYDNGRVVSIPDIRDANISASKTINSIEISSSGRIYLATGFGFVAIDDATHRVADSGIYNDNFSYACELGGKIALVRGNKLFLSDIDRRHNTFSSFTETPLGFTSSGVIALGSRYLLGYNPDNRYFLTEVDVEKPSSMTREFASRGDVLRMEPTRGDDGYVYLACGNSLYAFSAADGSFTTVSLPSFFNDKTLCMRRGLDGSVWVSDIEGIAEYSVSGGEVTVLRSPARPDAFTCSYPALMYVTPDRKRIYVGNIGYDLTRGQIRSTGETFVVRQTTNIIEDGDVRDVSYIESNGLPMAGSPEFMVQDPLDPSRYFIAMYQTGIYVLSTEDGSLIDIIGGDRLPFTGNSWATRCRHVSFDRYGNLWLSVRNNLKDDRNALSILPAEKLRNTANIKSEDWIIANSGAYKQGDGAVVLHHSKSNSVLVGSNHESTGLLVYDHKGNPTDIGVAESFIFSMAVDQDGQEFKINPIQCIKEDKNGQIWIGTNSGIFYIPDITSAVRNGQIHVRRPKVPRNDGTNYADYLVDGQLVFDIAFDSSNRKWLATQASGLYLVSEDGTEIIENFNTDNSLLPSNKVLSVACDPGSNIVYVGTANGLVSYSSTSSPAAQDYSDVYAYPNPVRPDYTGWITITGLMENSLVKITDTAGNVVRQGTSEGGMYMWDGCNSANRRVRSGVYFVFASQNASGAASGKPVTKIMVIN